MYLLISFVCLFLSYFFFKKAAGDISPKKMNMLSWIFWYSLFIQSFIASLLIIYNVDNHYGVQKLYFEESRVKGWLAVQYTMVFLPISMWFSSLLIKNKTDNKKVYDDFINSPLFPCLTERDKALRNVLYFLSIICMLAVFYSFYSVKMFPFQGYLNSSSIGSLRQEVTRDFGGIVYFKNIFGVILTPILSYVFYCYYRLFREKIDLFIFILLFVFSVSIVGFDYAKSPLAFYFLGFFFIKIALGDSVNYFKLLKYSFSVIFLIVGFYILTGYQDSILSLFSSYNSGFTGRLTISQAFGTYLSFDLYPSVYSHIGLSSLTDLIGEPRDRMAREIMTSINTIGIDEGTAGVINTLFVAEAWANFGLLGVIFSVLWVGFFVQLIYGYIITKRKNPLLIAVYAYLIYKLPITGGFNDFIYNPALFLSIVILVCIFYFVKFRVNKI